MIKGHLVNPKTEEWFHVDENHMLWTCNCKNNSVVSLCISITNDLEEEGNLNEIRRKTALKRKELNLLESLSVSDLEALLNSIKTL